MIRLDIYPNPLDSVCVLTLDNGQVFTGQAGTSYAGRPCQSFVLPDNCPQGNGCSLNITHLGKVPLVQRSILWTAGSPTVPYPWQPGQTAALEADDFYLQDGTPTPPPFVPCPREYSGNMCGIYIDGLPPVPGGSSNPALFLSWFYDRYPDDWRRRIQDEYRRRGFTDILVSWPDSRAVGHSAETFGNICRELVTAGFTPCVMLSSKVYDPPDVPEIQRRMAAVLPHLIQVAGRICVGWELSLWLQPVQVQELTDWLAPQVTPWGGKLYVHFQQGYASFDIDGPNASFAGYWNKNIGKLTGVLHQRDLGWDKPMYQARLVDVLERFAGQYNCSPDSGFGHPFDIVALEITAQLAFNDNMSEADQDAWGVTAVHAQPVNGPFGPVSVMGSGNGRV